MVTGCVLIFVLRIETTSSAVRLKTCPISAGSKKYMSIIKERRKIMIKNIVSKS